MFKKKKFSLILKKIADTYDNQRDFSKISGINRTYISGYINMKLDNPPSTKILKKISDYSNNITSYGELLSVCGYFSEDDFKNLSDVTLDEKVMIDKFTNLITDNEGNLDIENIDLVKEVVLDFADSPTYSPEFKNRVISKFTSLLSANIDMNINIKKLSNNIKRNRIPVLGKIPAGIPINAIEENLGYEELSDDMLKGGKEYFALKVIGDSMYPEYLEDDVLIVLKQSYCDDGDDCIVMVNGDDATFKRIHKDEINETIMLQPLNTQYLPVTYTNKQIEELPVKILGVVKEIRRKKVNKKKKRNY